MRSGASRWHCGFELGSGTGLVNRARVRLMVVSVECKYDFSGWLPSKHGSDVP